MTSSITLKQYIDSPAVQDRIKSLLKDKSQQFVVSLLSAINSNELLSKCEPQSVYAAAMTAASLNLPINSNLGYAYIIPYKDKAQFQMGYKGFIQLAQRSGQFVTINVTDVREGEIKSNDRLTGEIVFEWLKDIDRSKAPIVGYVSYIKLINGFNKSLYMTTAELKAHGLKFSQMAKRGYGLWSEDFDAMASKTVVKLLLAKYAPLTVEMQKAQLADQAVINEDENYEYVDNTPVMAEDIAREKEKTRILNHIKNSKTLDELEACKDHIIDADTLTAYKNTHNELEGVKEIK